jgi:hypothetical protein
MRRPRTHAAPLAAALLAAAALAANPARAVDINEGQLLIHGDGWWSYSRSSNQNTFDQATPVGNAATAMFDLLVRARITDDAVVIAQMGFDPDEVSAEYVFADLRLQDWLKLKVGKVPQPYGNLNELRFAGTSRAFFDVPSSVYGPTGFAGTSYMGIGLSGQHFGDQGWAYGFDAYAGSVNVEELEGYRGLLPGGDGEVPEKEALQARDAIGGRVWLAGPGEVTVRLSGYAGRYSGDADEPEHAFQSYALSLHYPGERVRAGVELAYRDEHQREHAWAGYGFVSMRLPAKFLVALRYEWTQVWLIGYSGSSPLLRHHAVGLALSYIYDTGLVFKAEYQIIDGNRLAFPGGLTSDELAAATLARRTGVLVAGMQFAF